MHNPEQQEVKANSDTGAVQSDSNKQAETIAETMRHPETSPEQLPELWQLLTEPDGVPTITSEALWRCWDDGIETMFRRCETYPQYTKLALVLSGMPNIAWRRPDKDSKQVSELLRQATPEQLLEALAYKQQQPEGWWNTSGHIMAWAEPGLLTGPVVEQLRWDSALDAWATEPGNDRWRRISDHIQRQLLHDNQNAWTVFCGIVELGHRIGETAELANAIAQQHEPARNKT